MPRALVIAPVLAVLAALCAPAQADAFRPVHDRGAFVRLTDGRELRLALFDIALRIAPDGGISGRALGQPVTGRWSWQDGYFCRRMDWNGRAIPPNCQLVEVKGGDTLRFTVDRGAGDSAQFRLK